MWVDVSYRGCCLSITPEAYGTFFFLSCWKASMLLSLGSTMTREGLTTDLFRLKSEPLHRPAPSRQPRYESHALDMGSWWDAGGFIGLHKYHPVSRSYC